MEDGVEAPTGAVLIQLGDEELEEHGERPVVHVRLHETPVDLPKRVHRHDHGDPGADENFPLGDSVGATSPGLRLPVALAKQGLVDDEDAFLLQEQVQHAIGKPVAEDESPLSVGEPLDLVDSAMP